MSRLLVCLEVERAKCVSLCVCVCVCIYVRACERLCEDGKGVHGEVRGVDRIDKGV